MSPGGSASVGPSLSTPGEGHILSRSVTLAQASSTFSSGWGGAAEASYRARYVLATKLW